MTTTNHNTNIKNLEQIVPYLVSVKKKLVKICDGFSRIDFF